MARRRLQSLLNNSLAIIVSLIMFIPVYLVLVNSLKTKAEANSMGIGLPAVREFRRRRLQTEHEARLAALDDMEATVPELNAVAVVRIDAKAIKNSEAAA